MSDTHSNAHQKLSDMPLEHLSDFDWNRCPTCFRTGVRHELESPSDLPCSTQPGLNVTVKAIHWAKDQRLDTGRTRCERGAKGGQMTPLLVMKIPGFPRPFDLTHPPWPRRILSQSY